MANALGVRGVLEVFGVASIFTSTLLAGSKVLSRVSHLFEIFLLFK